MHKHITDISIDMLKNYKQYYRTNDPWYHWVERLVDGLNKKIFFLKRHKTRLGISRIMVEVWQYNEQKT